jgi:hypothetical protein
MRLTLDRQVRGVFTHDWNVDDPDGGLPLLAGQVICEFKYQAFLPNLFKQIMLAMHLTPSSVSKYRAFLREACGMPTPAPQAPVSRAMFHQGGVGVPPSENGVQRRAGHA